MRLRRVKNNSYTDDYDTPSFFDFAEGDENRDDSSGGLIELIKNKRSLIDNCFEDENYGVEPC